MADFTGVTTSSSTKVKKGKAKALKSYLDKHRLGYTKGADNYKVVATVKKLDTFEKRTEGKAKDNNYYLNIWGYGWFAVYKDEELTEDITKEFIKGLAPYLAEPFAIQSIGNTKCRYPLSAWEAEITPKGEYKENSFLLGRWLD